MMRRLFWLAILAGIAYGAYWFFTSSSPGTHPHASPRAAVVTFCTGLESGDVEKMLTVCTGQAQGQLPLIRGDLEERARRGHRVEEAWPEGNTAPSGDHAQALIMIREVTGNTLPRWDAYLQRDTQGRWWIVRFSDR
jgi:hypothetical protein